MKKLILALILSLPAVAFGANQDGFGGMRPAVWRSSQSCGAFAWSLLSTGPVTGPIIIHSITVDSATVNNSAASFLSIYNSTATPIGGNSANFRSTGVLITANINVNNTPTSFGVSYDAMFSSGAVVNKAGTSCTTIWWDYLNPKTGDFYTPWKP